MSEETPKSKKGRKKPLERGVRAVGRLAVDATKQVTRIVEEVQHDLAAAPALLGRPFQALVKLLTSPVYASFRGLSDLVDAGMDRVLDELAPAFDEDTPPEEYDALRAALNGVLGDHLALSESPLAIKMELRTSGQALTPTRDAIVAALPAATAKLVVLVHGVSKDDSSWHRKGHDHGAALARELGFTPIYVRYNSGLSVVANGRELARLVERLVEGWPLALERLVVVGFGMGGLVSRAAILTAEDEGMKWRRALSGVATLGTPHHGAPLEHYGHVADVLIDTNRFSAPLVKLADIFSAGITDLRAGTVVASDKPRSTALPAGVASLAIAATRSPEVPEELGSRAADADALEGDGLVQVSSALGRHDDPAKNLGFQCQAVVPACGHLDLLESTEAWRHLHAWAESL
ncbi:alpha/beta hydrolase [Myxococcota bacterium]|nr:alpha/beta hydrolase [Myxococcota bacterium]